MNPRDVKIIFWGTSEFALPALDVLLEQEFRLLAVVTNPDKPAGRKGILTPPPVKKQIVNKGWHIEILQPKDLTSIRHTLLALRSDLFIVAAYGKLIPKEILNIPKFGALNIHPSLLPRWRGPAPIQYTILNGDAETGVTMIKMDEELDHGPIIASSKLQSPIKSGTSSKLTYQELHDRLAKLGAKLLLETLPKFIDGEIVPIPQSHADSTYSKILTKDDGRIDWSRPAVEIERMVRAFSHWPGAWTEWHAANQPRRLRIEETDLYHAGPHRMPEGTVWRDEKGAALVACGQGDLEIKKLTQEGSRTMRAEEFLRGRPDFIGAILG